MEIGRVDAELGISNKDLVANGPAAVNLLHERMRVRRQGCPSCGIWKGRAREGRRRAPK